MATTDNSATNATTNANSAVDGVTPTDYTKTQKVSVTEHHQGHAVDFNSDIDTDYTGQFDDRFVKLVNGAVESALKEREARENIRANHRNLNRALTLLGALIIGLILTFVFQHNGIPGLVTMPKWTKAFAAYTFVITIAMDSTFTFYALWKHY